MKVVRRVAMLLTMIGLLGVGLSGVSQGATDIRYTVKQISLSAAELSGSGVLSNCPIKGPSGEEGAFICATTALGVFWTYDGFPIAQDFVVIGTDYKVYHDSGQGWTPLQGGVATQERPASQIGLYNLDMQPDLHLIGVWGTDIRRWCNATTSPGVWQGWIHC